MGAFFLLCRHWRVWPWLAFGVLSNATAAYAQPAGASPWERAAQSLATTFTGSLARSLSLVAIVIAGLMFMFGESGSKRQIAGIVFGGGLALLATQFLGWLFPTGVVGP